MTPPDQAAVQTLRSDLALQIARHVGRAGGTQSAAADRLGIPQPTLSKIMRGRVEALSLELMLRVAMRAGLAVVLQTGTHPAEAGVHVSAPRPLESRRTPSRLGDAAREAARGGMRALTPTQRLAAHLEHAQLVAALHRAGRRR
jgi:predicted XRE-type DNA-binding protein